MSNDASTRCAAPAFTGCDRCPLRRLPVFQPVRDEELHIIDELKTSEIDVEAGARVIAEGQSDGPLYTLLSGWAFRFKTLPDGRRQILNFMLPGDFVGLQQKMTDAASHGVEALTELRLCRFPRDAVWTLHRELPSLGYDVTWLSANEGSLLDDNLLSVGRRTAVERVAALLLTLATRAAPFEPRTDTGGLRWPLTQQHVADAMGLSLVHTNRTLRELFRRGLADWRDGRLLLPDAPGLARLARLRWPLRLPPRPLI